MLKIIRLLIASTLFISLLIFGQEQEVSASKKQLIDELIVLSGADKMGEMFSGVFVQQMTRALKTAKPDVNPKAFDIVREEVNRVIHEEITEKNALNLLSYPLYDQYFTDEDLAAIIVFYKSDVGKKVLTLMPKITLEGLELGKNWGKSIAPIIQQRVFTRLQEEGIVLP